MPPIEAQRDAFSFIDRLDELSTVEKVTDVFAEAVARYGVKHFIVTGVSTARPLEELVVASRAPAAFFTLYVEKRYQRFDPLIRRSLGSHMPFEWRAASYLTDHDARVVEIMRRRTEYGLNHGYLVPIHGPDGNEGCVSMAANSLDLATQAKLALHVMALYAFDRMRGLRDSLSGSRSLLTPREREVLSWIGAGKSAEQIGHALKISKRTVDEHSQTAARKLGAANRTEAVAIALRDRIIQFPGVPSKG